VNATTFSTFAALSFFITRKYNEAKYEDPAKGCPYVSVGLSLKLK
jgi:hypothetical protein